MRVNIPKNPDELIQLAQHIITKHAADGTGSALSALDMTDLDAKTKTADTENKSAAQLYRDAEKATQNRDLALGSDNAVKGTLAHYVRSVRDVLLGLYKGNEQRLGDWGFEVVASARTSVAGEPVPAPTKS